MKARYTTRDGRITFEMEAATPKGLFDEIAGVQEVFDAESSCGLCGSTDIRFSVREADGKGKQQGQKFTYYELRCQGILEDLQPCRGRFDFGQSLDTKNLFPKRKADEGEPEKGPRGWYRYVSQNYQAEPPAAARTQRTDSTHTSNAPRAFDGATQERINRMAAKWNVSPAPVTIGALMTMIRNHCAGITLPSTRGAQEFDKLYRRFAFENKTTEEQMRPDVITQFMVECWEAAEVLENGMGVPI